MGNTIYIHEVTDSYAACITNMTLYGRVAIDVAKRWVSRRADLPVSTFSISLVLRILSLDPCTYSDCPM